MAPLAAVAVLITAAAALSSAGARTVQIDAWGPDSLRIRIAAPNAPSPAGDPAFMPLLPTPPASGDRINSAAGGVTIGNSAAGGVTNGNIAAVADAATGLLTVTRVSDGAVLLTQPTLEAWGPVSPHANPASSSVTLTLSGTAADEHVYGFGQLQDGGVRKRLPFFQSIEHTEFYPNSHGSNVLIPWMMTTRGYGILWNLPAYGWFSVATSSIQFHANATLAVDFWVTTTPAAGGNPWSALLSNYGAATGLPPELPSFATGFVQCKDRYRNQTQLLDVAKGYKSRGLPISMIVQDWFHCGCGARSPVAAVEIGAHTRQ